MESRGHLDPRTATSSPTTSPRSSSSPPLLKKQRKFENILQIILTYFVRKACIDYLVKLLNILRDMTCVPVCVEDLKNGVSKIHSRMSLLLYFPLVLRTLQASKS